MNKFLFFMLFIAIGGCQRAGQVQTAAINSDLLIASMDLEFLASKAKDRLGEEDRARLHHDYPRTLDKIDTLRPLGLHDIQNLTRAGMRDDEIIRLIIATESQFFLLPSDEAHLRQIGISQKVIQAMKQTASDRY